MLKKATVLLYLICSCYLLKGQISNEEICKIYSKIIYDLKTQVKKDYGQKELFVSNQILKINNFPKFIEQMKPLFGGELDEKNIDYKQLAYKTDTFNFKCLTKDINLITEGDYHMFHKKNVKKHRGLCTFSNIGYSDKYAFVGVIVQLSYSRRYSNFYFFQKDSTWKLIYFREGCD